MNKRFENPEGEPKLSEADEYRRKRWRDLEKVANELNMSPGDLRGKVAKAIVDSFNSEGSEIWRIFPDNSELISPEMLKLLFPPTKKKQSRPQIVEKRENRGALMLKEAKKLYESLKVRYGEEAVAKYFKDFYPSYDWKLVTDWLAGRRKVALDVGQKILDILNGFHLD